MTTLVVAALSAREIGDYAVDGGGIDLVWRSLAHAAVVWLLGTGLTLLIFGCRLRLARYEEPWRDRGRQHFLYLRPEPHQQWSLRSGGHGISSPGWSA